MSTSTEKYLIRLMEEIEKKGLESSDEINDFLNKFNQEQSFDDLPKKTDKKGRAQELVFEAYNQPVAKGKALVKRALELDPDSVDAYSYLGSKEKNIEKAIVFFEKAIKAGEKKLGKEFFEEYKGDFWGLLETRPYMRAKAGLADCFYAKNEIDKAIEIYKEMLELNPNDNQGIRYLLSTLLLSKNDLKGFEAFIKNSEEESCATWNYNNALYQFKKSGQTPKSNKALLEAYKSNEFVIDYLLGNKKMPNKLPQYVSWGDESEAIAYVSEAWKIWEKTEGAFDWLYHFRQKRLKVN